jgi:uncharacterized protein (TIGR02996 family)
VKLDPLLERVLADPSDDALREVWADALQERGDPLGELIAIQAIGRRAPLTRAQDQRRRSLIAKHRVEWLGPLADVVQHREGLDFDRGVLVGCQVQIKRLPAIAAAVGHPLWGAMKRMWFCDGYAVDARIVPLLVHPVMRSLRELICIGENNVFAALARHDRPLPIEAIWLTDDSHRTTSFALAHIDALPGLPALRRLGFDRWDDDPARIMQLPVVHLVETLGITNRQTRAGTWLACTAELPILKKLVLRRWWIPVQGPNRSDWVLRFERGASGAWSHLTIVPLRVPRPENIQEDLASLPDTLERITAPAVLAPLLKRFTRAVVTA